MQRTPSTLSTIDSHARLAHQRREELLAQADHERLVRLARRAAPDFVPRSRWLDPAYWSALIGPVVGVGFLSYFALEVARAVGG